MNIEKFNNLVIEIKKDLTQKQDLLCKKEIGSEEYNSLFNDVLVLKKELDIIVNLNLQNIYDLKQSLSDKYNKYGFLIDLSKKQLNLLINVLDKFRNVKLNYSKIEISEILNDVKEHLKLNNINISEINSIEELEFMLDTVFSMSNEFDIDMDFLKNKLDIVDIDDYSLLYLNVKNSEYTPIKTLKAFNRLSQESIVERIIDNKKELHKLSKMFIKPKKIIDRIDILKLKILDREKIILNNINDYMTSIISNYKDKLNIGDYSLKINNLTLLYYEIFEKINIKRNEYDKLSDSLNDILKKSKNIEQELEMCLNKIDSSLYEKVKNSDIKLFDLNKDNLNTIEAEINVYKKINNLEKEKTVLGLYLKKND